MMERRRFAEPRVAPTVVRRGWGTFFHQVLEWGLVFYKQLLAPMLGFLTRSLGFETSCRFQPTCSEYTTLAFAQHGPMRGFRLSAYRLLRCHPFARGGWDPVPVGRGAYGHGTGVLPSSVRIQPRAEDPQEGTIE